ncbi:MAG: HNH endonuclease [Micrococcales bacterium]|nr:HNH endonuclease [Micrococcales bacterium]
MSADLPEEFVTWLRSREMSARAKKAVEFMLAHGSVTTADIEAMGYDHPPRAIGDVKDAGIRLAKSMITVGGHRMARYTLIVDSTLGHPGRTKIPKKFRDTLFAAHDHRCAMCGASFTTRELQADHRVPFRVAGDGDQCHLDDFMPLCASDNRAKSFTCESCPNWTRQDPAECRTCVWGSPADFCHIATRPHRQITITWTDAAEVEHFDRLAAVARALGLSPSAYAKAVLDREAERA